MQVMGKPENKRNRFQDYGGSLSLEDLCYADVAEIRLVFGERRHGLWLELADSEQSDEELKATKERFYTQMSEMSPIGICNRILEACQDVEDEIQGALGEENKPVEPVQKRQWTKPLIRKVMYWYDSRQDQEIEGVVVREDDEWIDIQLIKRARVGYGSVWGGTGFRPAYAAPGCVLRRRKCLLKEVSRNGGR